MRDDAERAKRKGPRRHVIPFRQLDRKRRLPLLEHWRPSVRGDCANVPRPCPYVGCRHNLYLDVSATGSLFIARDVEPWEVDESCSLDVAQRGESTQEQVAELLNVTRFGLQKFEGATRRRLGLDSRGTRALE